MANPSETIDDAKLGLLGCYCRIAAKGRSVYKMCVNMETRRSKDDPYVVKIVVENLAEMEERIESLLTEGFTAKFEQLRSQMYMESRGSETRKLPDAASGRRTIVESIGDDNGEQSRRMPTDEDSSYLVQGGKPDDERIENKQSEYDLNLKGREMKQTNKDKHISKEENVKKLFTINEWKNGDENAMIWSSGCDHACIFLEDFLLLLQEGDVGNTSLIRLNNKQIGDERSPRLTHLIDKELEQLDNKLQQKWDYFRYLVFPMNSTGNRDEDGTPYHWTLLVFDIQDKEWRHFNSKKPRDQGSQDPCMEDALIVKTYVEGYMANMHGKKQEPRRTLFQDQDFNAPISSVEKAPQQSETS
ncbi:hypothetical protein RHGRI_012173 [Rhododendron griersonianum]|uniref:Ubiquitin-like protease family profile domain-containing protein n=1 Tax=Rhododendron griersonianum TaxID=479676 RepID=A0AAV6KQT9_9ERIC|nr:hypothetical protein RHGRI_012173 [Rhododendron griersonianum]